MGFVPDHVTSVKGGRFIPEEPETPWSDVPGNAVKDLGGLAKAGAGAIKQTLDPLNVMESAKAGSLEPTKEYLGHAADTVKGLPGALYAHAKDLVTNPVETFKRNPVNTALDVFGAAEVGLKALRGAPAATEAASLADDVAKTAAPAVEVPKAPPVMNVGDEAAQILKQAPEPVATSVPEAPQIKNTEPSGVGSIVDQTVDALGNKAKSAIQGPLDEVTQFLESKYGKVASNESWPQTLGDMMTRKAQSLRFKEMGANPMQIRKLYEKIGEDKLRALSDLAEEKGITGPIRGYSIGKKIEGLETSSGQTTGGIRQIATKRGAIHNADNLLQTIKAELDSKYLKGGASSSEKGNYLKALQDIKNTEPTAEAVAETATRLNRYGAENKMVQKKGAFADVANAASRANNQLIEKFLSPKEAQMYAESLRDFGAAKIFKRFYGNRVGRELSGRSSGIGGIWGEAKNMAADIGGNKLMEKSFDKFGRKLKANPDIAKSFGSLSQEALSDILSALDEVIDEVGKPQ